MILRTPPPKRPRDDAKAIESPPMFRSSACYLRRPCRSIAGVLSRASTVRSHALHLPMPPNGDAGKLVDSYISGKITQLKEQIATLEKREERYRNVFAERILVFRRACCELFGYKIVMDEHQRSNGIPVTRFTLQSIYAQSDDEKLEFECESGNTNILANAYTSQSEISRQVDIFIHKMNSIPAFTANLTVESINRRTLS